MSVVVFIDGRARPPGEQVVSVFDRGFLYGDSIFETVRTYGGRPFSLAAHLRRLRRSAERVQIPLEPSDEQLAAEVGEAVALAENPESYVRIIVTRGAGAGMGLDPALAERPCRVVLVGPLSPPPKEQYERGIRVATYRCRRPADGTAAAGAKVGNYLVAVLATRHAKGSGAQEALIVDDADMVSEGATSNVFAVIGDRVVTPGLDAGILEGITRGHILEVARQLGLSVELRAIPLAELQSADEVFITSSIRELLSVTHIDEVPVGSGEVGPVSRRLLAAFRRAVASSHGASEPSVP